MCVALLVHLAFSVPSRYSLLQLYLQRLRRKFRGIGTTCIEIFDLYYRMHSSKLAQCALHNAIVRYKDGSIMLVSMSSLDRGRIDSSQLTAERVCIPL